MTSTATLTAPFQIRPRPRLGLGNTLIGEEEEKLVLDVLRRGELFRYYGKDPKTPPPMAATLEKEFAAYIGTKFALGLTSGTAALETALGALGCGPGDEVIIPAWGWISCFTAIIRVGATPVMAEIDDSFSIAAGEIKRLANKNTKCVCVLHYQGVAVDMDVMMAESREAGIKVLEDCAQSAGASFKGKKIGSFGDIGCFSFQHNKVITSGEGGAVVTSDPALYERAVRMHDIGLVRPYHAQIVTPSLPAFSGGQYRLSELTAAVALAQLRKLDKIKAHCRRLQARVLSQISDLPGIKLRKVPDTHGDIGFEIYFRIADEKLAVEFRKRLDALNVNSNKVTGSYGHYARDYCQTGQAHSPAASPFTNVKPWPAKGYRREDFPRTEQLAKQFVALPIGMQYTDEDADYIGQCVRKVHGELLGT